jgi:hypothetical protein
VADVYCQQVSRHVRFPCVATCHDNQANQPVGVSRAELIRQLIDSGLSGTGSADLETDLAAIAESFGALADSDFLARAADDRARHLDRIAQTAKAR